MSSTPLSALRRMSPIARAALLRAGLRTLEAAAAKPDGYLLALKGFKAHSLAWLRRWEKDPADPELAKKNPRAREVIELMEALKKSLEADLSRRKPARRSGEAREGDAPRRRKGGPSKSVPTTARKSVPAKEE